MHLLEQEDIRGVLLHSAVDHRARHRPALMVRKYTHSRRQPDLHFAISDYVDDLPSRDLLLSLFSPAQLHLGNLLDPGFDSVNGHIGRFCHPDCVPGG